MLHPWYLNQEYAALSLFSKNVSDKEKSEIAKELLEIDINQVEYGMGQPNWLIGMHEDLDAR